MVCSAMLSSCQKEDAGTMTTLNLFTEESSMGDSKMAVDGLSMKWCNGDQVRINNNGVFNVSVSGNSATVTAQYSAFPFSTPLRVLSPDISSSNITSDQHQISLPSTYTYATTTLGGTEVQRLSPPMAAYAAHGNNLYFKYLTGALTVNLKNSTTKTIYIEDITITSDIYKLCGSKTINFTRLTNIVPETTNVEWMREVTMKCNRKAVAAGTTLPVQIPVLPVGADNHFTVKVRYIIDFDEWDASGSDANDRKHYYTYTRTQSDKDNSLGRGKLGYVPILMEVSGSTSNQRDFFFKDEDGYYLISTPKELKWLSMLSNLSNNNIFPSGQKVKLTNDIDMTPPSSITNWYFSPIKKVTEFDGNNKTISNLKLERGGSNNYRNGLLNDENSSNITVKDLTMDNCTLLVQSSTMFAGFMLAYAGNNATITNCDVTSSKVQFVTSSASESSLYIGGICGYVAGVATLTTCHVTDLRFLDGDYVSSYPYLFCGGLVGSTTTGILENCSVRIVASNTDQGIKNQKSGGVTRFGGLVGYHSSTDNNLQIIRSNNGSVSTVKISSVFRVTGNTNSSTVYAGAFCGLMPYNREIVLRPYYLSTIRTEGSFTVTATNKYIGSSSNSYVCGGGNSYNIIYPPSSYTINLGLIIY